MKKIFTVLVVLAVTMMFASVAGAQERGQQAAGLNFEIGAGDNYTNYGLGFKYQYTIVDHIRVEPSFIYFFRKDHVSMWDMTANIHYIFSPTYNINVYPIVGLGVTQGRLDDYFDNYTFTKFAFNFGGGAEYMLTDVIGVSFEYKYRIVDNLDRSHFVFGVTYKF